MKKRRLDLSRCAWHLTGYYPWEWQLGDTFKVAEPLAGEIPPVPADVPGSVQRALREAGVLPDWNEGLQAHACEWVENRHWIYRTVLPDDFFEEGNAFRLRCDGLDDRGTVYLNRREVLRFSNSHVPHAADLTPYLRARDNELLVVFECPPRWLGQFGRTSEMTDWKPRFNYFWDWTSRLVQIGIWDALYIERFDAELETLRLYTDVCADGRGMIQLHGSVRAPDDARLTVRLRSSDGPLAEATVSPFDLGHQGITLRDLDVEPWWPNGHGAQPLYDLDVVLADTAGEVLDEQHHRVGFKTVRWERNPGAPREATPWLCHVNDEPVFLQGVNWTPIRPNFADVTEAQYRTRLETYRDLGVNVLRVWGGAFLEKACFYRLCDEMGLLVWQEFPLSSSGVENDPPSDAASLAALTTIARADVARRQQHVSLLLWCGGNELRAEPDADEPPVDVSHPLMRRLEEVVHSLDPTRRFLPTTPYGPTFFGRRERFGQGQHWAVNGPWKVDGAIEDGWMAYWEEDDALLRSETGVPGASPTDLIERYRGRQDVFPCSTDTPLWRRHPWWVEWDQFTAEHGREAESLDEYVAWSQERQARALAHAARCCKDRFPACGGFIIWMGHDSFPCAANTSILDFDGRPKPAAHAVAEVFRAPQPEHAPSA